MAKNIIINNSTYQNVEQIQFAKEGGGTATYIDAETLSNQGYKLKITNVIPGNVYDVPAVIVNLPNLYLDLYKI